MVVMRAPEDLEMKEIVTGNAKARPDLDFEPLKLYFQLHRIAALLDEPRSYWAKSHGLTVAEVGALLALFRMRPSYKLRPTDLHQRLLISTGAITKLIDRLEKLSLVRRVGSNDDRRSLYVQLTDKGRALASNTLSFVASTLALFESKAELSKAEQKQLGPLILKLVTGAEAASQLRPPKNAGKKSR